MKSVKEVLAELRVVDFHNMDFPIAEVGYP